jgi:HNH endonuclease
VAKFTEKRVRRVLLKRRKVTPVGCWEWTGSRHSKGYGHVWIEWKHYRVHRLAAWLWLGFDLDSDGLVLHRCDNPPCFNPKHLYIGTNSDNQLKRWQND